MNSSSLLSVVIPAAGIGSRMASDTPKQYLHIAGKTVLEHAIEVFINHPRVYCVIICLHPNDTVFASLPIASHPKVNSVVGGDTRAKSVLSGLQALDRNTNSDWVMVHDAARPGLSQAALNRLIAAQEKHSGAILALPVVDTLKAAKVSTDKSQTSISATVDRSQLWQAQTPQMFKIQRLLMALNSAINNSLMITDEASAVEYLGDDIVLIEGEASNMKITRPDDLALAEFYLQQQNTTRDPL